MGTEDGSYSVEDPWSTNVSGSRGGASAATGQHGSATSSRPLTWAAAASSHDDEGRHNGGANQVRSPEVLVNDLPPLFEKVFDMCRAAEQSEDMEISLGQLGKVVRTAPGLTASDVEEIINLSCSSTSSHCSKEEYATALVLVAQVQAGHSLDVHKAKDVLSEPGTGAVPEPQLDLGKLRASTFMARSQSSKNVDALTTMTVGRRASTKMTNSSSTSSTMDPWAVSREESAPRDGLPASVGRSSTLRAWDEEASGSDSGNNNNSRGPSRPTSRPRSPLFSPVYVSPHPTSVHLLPKLGGFLIFRHVLYLVKTPICAGVKRRYSDFVSLHEYLLARYPFRLIPPLPPKRLSLPHMNRTQAIGNGQQDAFLEQRRLALARYTRSIMSHPVLRKDAVVLSFYTSGAVATNERGRAAVAEAPSSSSSASQAEANASSWKGVEMDEPVIEEGLDDSWRLSEADVMHVPIDMEDKLKTTREHAGTVLERWNGVLLVFERQVRRTEAMSAESTRLSLALSSLLEIEEQTYQGASADDDADETTSSTTAAVHNDAFRGSSTLMVANSQDYADLYTARFHALQHTLDALKNGRDAWLALKELFRRHDKLGRDPIPDLEARIEAGRKRWKQTHEDKKPGWQEQCARIKQDIEKDQRLIERFRRRNQRVRVALWHEVARMQQLKHHILVDWQAFAKNEAVHLAATKQAAEELALALDHI